MPLTFLVSRQDEPARTDEFLFNQDRVLIGRDAASDLTLPDPNRMVSKQHALVERQEEAWSVTDLGSKNLTFLNERRLIPNQPVPIHDGDRLGIGDYSIAFRVVPEPVPEPEPEPYRGDVTMMMPGLANPFDEDARALADVVGRIARGHAAELPGRADDALRDAVARAFESVGEDASGVLALVASTVQPVDPTATAFAVPARRRYGPPPTLTPLASPPASAPAVPPPPLPPPAEPAWAASFDPSPPPPAAARDASDGEAHAAAQAVDLLLDAAVRLSKSQWQFRLEFLGQTVVDTPGTFALHTATPAEARAHLLDGRVPQDERNRRLALVEQAVEDVLVHQVAVLEGYREGVKDGVERLLAELDPENLPEDETEKRGVLGFSFGGRDRALERMERRYREIAAEHRSSFEKRLFRAAFVRAYLRTVDVARSDHGIGR